MRELAGGREANPDLRQGRGSRRRMADKADHRRFKAGIGVDEIRDDCSGRGCHDTPGRQIARRYRDLGEQPLDKAKIGAHGQSGASTVFSPFMDDQPLRWHERQHRRYYLLRNPPFLRGTICRPSPAILRPQTMNDKGIGRAAATLHRLAFGTRRGTETRRPGKGENIMVDRLGPCLRREQECEQHRSAADEPSPSHQRQRYRSARGKLHLRRRVGGRGLPAQGAGIAQEFPGGDVLKHRALCKLAIHTGEGADIEAPFVKPALAFFGEGRRAIAGTAKKNISSKLQGRNIGQ